MPGQTNPKQPAYQGIQRAIQERIKREKLKPGDAVPSERELARAHGVSLMTARNALAGLERQGVVERRRGSGTFVAVPRIEYNKLVSTTELMASRGFSARSRVLCAKIVDDQPEIAARLGMADHSSLVMLQRLRQVAKEPLAVETNYFPAGQFKDLVRQTLERGSLFATLEENYKIGIAYADEEIDATAADQQIAAWLKIRENTPVLRIRQVIHSTTGTPILYGIGHYRSDRHKLLIRRFRR